MSVQDRLDRALLERDEAPSHAHARRLLGKKYIVVKKIIATRPEAILYCGWKGQPWTAWLTVHGDELEIQCERGFPAEPDDELSTVVYTVKLKEL